MAESSGFFKSINDRKYTVDWLAKYIASFIGNGVYNGELAVTADGSAMSVTLPTGRAWINGYHYRNDGDLTLAIDNADGVLNRIDVVVLRWDVNARSITAQVIKGTPASNAMAPAITRTVEQYDLKLAEISIPAGTTAISQALITDTRLDKSACGIVTGVLDQVDTTTFYNQIKADLAEFKSGSETDFTAWSTQQKASFDSWIAGIKDILGDDEAGNLLNLIEGHKADTTAHVTQAEHNAIASAVQGATIGGTAVPKNDGVLDFPMPTAKQTGALPHNPSVIVDPDNMPDGIYYYSGHLEIPANTTGDGEIIQISYNQSFIIQIAYGFHLLSGMAVRVKESGTWLAWSKISANKADYASGSIPLATPGLRNITMSTAEPSGGQDGDMWIQYS